MAAQCLGTGKKYKLSDILFFYQYQIKVPLLQGMLKTLIKSGMRFQTSDDKSNRFKLATDKPEWDQQELWAQLFKTNNVVS